MHNTSAPRRILRKPAVAERVGYSEHHICRLERAGLFPKRVPLGPNAVGWLEAEVDAWIAGRVAERDIEAA